MQPHCRAGACRLLREFGGALSGSGSGSSSSMSCSGGDSAPSATRPGETWPSLGFQKRETEVYVGNLPVDVSEEDIRYLLKDFGPLRVRQVRSGCRCFAFVDLGSARRVALAIQELNGTHFHQRKLYVNSSRSPHRKTPDVAERPRELPVPEKASRAGGARITARTQRIPKAPSGPQEPASPQTAASAVPMEMRGSFLVLLLRECFQDLSWLATVGSATGEAGLLVTSIVAQTPFFWAMRITETLQENMQALFGALAEAEERQPYLSDSAVRRGTRGLAQHHLGDHGPAWNRCWVVDRVDTWAVVMFIDFGQLATVPVRSLRSLDSDDFWAIPPLTQPFMLEEGVLTSYEVIHRILKGKITGALTVESHILSFEEFR